MRQEGLKGVVRGKKQRTTIPPRTLPDPLTSLIAALKLTGRTASGSPTSPTSPPAQGSPMRRSLSTSTHGSSSGGGSRRRCVPTWLSTLSNKHSGPATLKPPILTAAWCIIPTPHPRRIQLVVATLGDEGGSW